MSNDPSESTDPTVATDSAVSTGSAASTDSPEPTSSHALKLSPIALALTAAVVWGAAIFVIGSINALVPGYGEAVLSLVVSIYPGYDADGSLGDLLLGSGYAFFDGLVGGYVFTLLYNFVARLATPRSED